MFPPVPHRRLLNESVMLGSEAILQKLPVEYSRELELAIQAAVRHAVLHYAGGMADTLAEEFPSRAGVSTGDLSAAASAKAKGPEQVRA
jgi:hypothetical protein